MNHTFSHRILPPLLLVLFGSLLSGLAVASGCPSGTVKIGERSEETPDAIVIHPICQQIADASEQAAAAARTYTPSGNALIGGTGWIFGYNAVPGSNPKVLKHAQELARRLSEEEGIAYNESIAFERYNFVLGIAASTTALDDLGARVLFDELRAGQASAETQALYNSLKGRQFDELACHSNGAMVCLAALENGDIKADHVVLFGPQITLESLRQWNDLIEKTRPNHIATLQLYLNTGDPVPMASLLGSNLGTLAASPLLLAPLSRAPVLAKTIQTIAPGIHTTIFDCANGFDVKCHELQRYKENRGDCAKRSTIRVRGTSLPGTGDYVEPPPPC
jgi:hypothetical protein